MEDSPMSLDKWAVAFWLEANAKNSISSYEVHRALGPGLLESIYETALCIELQDRGLKYARQVCVSARYKGQTVGEYRVDLIVEDRVVVEVKCVANITPVFEAQLMAYLRLTGKRVGLLINFNARLIKDDLRRKII